MPEIFRSLSRHTARLKKIRLPVLTASEKFALLTLTLLLAGGGALRAWEHAGVRIGPVRDWETLRQLVIRAKSGLEKTEGGVDFACADEAASGRFGDGTGEGEGAGPEILSAGFGSAGRVRTAGSRSDSRKKAPARPVDLNAASEKTLLTLPGVGPSTAKAILAYRTAHGKFRTVEDLLQVKGIGPKKLEALRPFARVPEARGAEATAVPAEKPETSGGPPQTSTNPTSSP